MNPFKGLPEVFVRATVEVTYRGQTQTVVPQLKLEPTGGTYCLPVPIQGEAGRQVMLKLNPPTPEEQDKPLKSVTLETVNAYDPYEVVLMDVSTKPGIGLVWLGALLYTLGGFVAYRRRALGNGPDGDSGPLGGKGSGQEEPPYAREVG